VVYQPCTKKSPWQSMPSASITRFESRKYGIQYLERLEAELTATRLASGRLYSLLVLEIHSPARIASEAAVEQPSGEFSRVWAVSALESRSVVGILLFGYIRVMLDGHQAA
jgi:hypothetical protein